MLEELIARSSSGQVALAPVEGALYGLSRRLNNLLDCRKLLQQLINVEGTGDDAKLQTQDLHDLIREGQVASSTDLGTRRPTDSAIAHYLNGG